MLIKKNILYLISLYIFSASIIIAAKPKDYDLKVLEQERTTDLVIINDVDEIISKPGAITTYLTLALNNNQIILCTKSIWLTLNKKYGKLTSYLKEIDDFFKNSLYGKKEEADNPLLSIYSNYICKDLDNFLLFIPKEKELNHDSNLIKDAWLGLSYHKFPDYLLSEYIDSSEFSRIKSESYTLSQDIKSLSKKLLDTLKSLCINPQEISFELLPFFNIFLTGHGDEDMIAEIDIYPVKNENNVSYLSYFLNFFNFNKNEKDKLLSYFLQILNLFNTSYRTSSLTLSSCYMGSKKIIDAYQLNSKYNNNFLEKISYPIINIGTFYNITYASNIHEDLFINFFKYLKETPPDYSKICKLFLFNINNYVSIKFPHTSWFSPVELEKNTLSLSQIDMITKEEPILINKNKKIIFVGANYIPRTIEIINNDNLPIFFPANYHHHIYYFTFLNIPNLVENLAPINLFWPMILNNLISGYNNIYPVLEPIIFFFKKIQIKDITYQDVTCFHFIKEKGNSTEQFKSGLSYTDATGKTIVYSWLSHKIPKDLPPEIFYNEKTSNLLKQVQETILQKNNNLNSKDIDIPIVDIVNNNNTSEVIKKNILKILPNGLNPEFIKKLETKLKARQAKTQKTFAFK